MRDGEESVALCQWCGTPVQWNTLMADEWTHWHGGRYCRVPGSTYTSTPIRAAEPTVFEECTGSLVETMERLWESTKRAEMSTEEFRAAIYGSWIAPEKPAIEDIPKRWEEQWTQGWEERWRKEDEA